MLLNGLLVLTTDSPVKDDRQPVVEDAGELASDVAAADHQQACRERIEVEVGVRVDDVLASVDVGQAERAAGGDEDVLRGEALFAGLTSVLAST